DGIRDFHVTGVQTCALPIQRDQQLIEFFQRRGQTFLHAHVDYLLQIFEGIVLYYGLDHCVTVFVGEGYVPFRDRHVRGWVTVFVGEDVTRVVRVDRGDLHVLCQSPVMFAFR